MSRSTSSSARGSRIPMIALTATLTVLSLSACGDDSVTRPAEPDVRLSVKASSANGTPEEPLTFNIAVWNAGGGDVNFYQDCCHGPVDLAFIDPAGDVIYLQAPVFCRCLSEVHSLPREPLAGMFSFTGSIWKNGETLDAPSGHYRIVATFDYRAGSEGPEEILQKTVFFDWSNP